MLLVTGITMKDGRVTADAIDTKGGPSAVAPTELLSQGLPKFQSHLSNALRTSFKDWKPGSLEEYACAANFPPPPVDNHTVWVFYSDGRRYVVPALALIRSLASARSPIYPHLFKPQSLEDICAWDDTEAQVLVEGVPTYRPRRTVPGGLLHNDTLGWMFCFPSARRAWASVYRAAKVGRLHLELPDATVAMKLRVFSFGRTDYVHSIRLMGVEPEEEPFEFASHHTRVFETPRQPEVESGAPYIPLTDAEWNAVADIVIHPEYPLAQPRETLDTFRLKAHDGRTWAQAAAAFNTKATRVATLHANWTKNGKLQLVNEKLARFQAAAALVSKPTRADPPLHSSAAH